MPAKEYTVMNLRPQLYIVTRFMAVPRSYNLWFLMGILLTGCAAIAANAPSGLPVTPSASPTEVTLERACPVTEPVWAKFPEDSAVQDPPAYGYYFLNEDRSIWASASWTEQEDTSLHVSEEGIKVGWFRPTGAELAITGQRLDADAPPLEADVPCCYPTRFQATGLYFPTEGCWQVTAKAAGRELSFVIWVKP
jgi:hypothetical protein